MKNKQFNINNKVRVRLTDHGRAIHRARYDEMPNSYRERYPYSPPKEVDGWWEDQMWSIMQLFGPHQFLGGNPPFDIVIEFRESDLKNPATQHGDE